MRYMYRKNKVSEDHAKIKKSNKFGIIGLYLLISIVTIAFVFVLLDFIKVVIFRSVN